MEEERYYKRNNNEILVEQGDIFTNINMEIFTKKSKNANQEEIIWSNVLVVSQSCDLHREQENKKELPSNEILSVLVVPIFNLSTKLRNSLILFSGISFALIDFK